MKKGNSLELVLLAILVCGMRCKGILNFNSPTNNSYTPLFPHYKNYRKINNLKYDNKHIFNRGRNFHQRFSFS